MLGTGRKLIRTLTPALSRWAGEGALALVFALVLLVPGRAHAQTDEARCTDSMEAPDIRVGACSRLIESGRYRDDADKLGTWYYNRGHAHRSNRDSDLAIADYGRTLEVLPQAINAANSRGDLHFKAGRYREAAEDFQRAVKIDAENVQALNNLGLAQTQMQQWNSAYDTLGRAIALAPKWDDPYENRAYVLLQLRRYDEAIADAGKAVEINASSGFGYRLRGEGLYETGKYGLAVRQFDAAVQFSPQDTYAYLGRALALYRDKETARARKDVEAVQRLAPDNAWIANRLCYQLALADQAKEALPHCDRAVARAPGDPDYHDSRGFAFLRLKQPDKALADYNETLKRDPKHALAMYGRCLVLRQLGQTREAETDCNDARSLDAGVEAFFAAHGLTPR